MVSIQIKMMMDQDEMDYVWSSIYLGNYKDDGDKKKIKIMESIHIKKMMMDKDYTDSVGN